MTIIQTKYIVQKWIFIDGFNCANRNYFSIYFAVSIWILIICILAIHILWIILVKSLSIRFPKFYSHFRYSLLLFSNVVFKKLDPTHHLILFHVGFVYLAHDINNFFIECLFSNKHIPFNILYCPLFCSYLLIPHFCLVWLGNSIQLSLEELLIIFNDFSGKPYYGLSISDSRIRLSKSICIVIYLL